MTGKDWFLAGSLLAALVFLGTTALLFVSLIRAKKIRDDDRAKLATQKSEVLRLKGCLDRAQSDGLELVTQALYMWVLGAIAQNTKATLGPNGTPQDIFGQLHALPQANQPGVMDILVTQPQRGGKPLTILSLLIAQANGGGLVCSYRKNERGAYQPVPVEKLLEILPKEVGMYLYTYSPYEQAVEASKA